jgi:hypothetical protein
MNYIWETMHIKDALTISRALVESLLLIDVLGCMSDGIDRN